MTQDAIARAYGRMLQRFEEDLNECWLFQGAMNCSGYGNVYVGSVDGKKVVMNAHKVSYLANHGPLGEGQEVRHTCDVRSCFNPHHLECGTKLDNLYDILTRQRDKNGKIAQMVKSMEEEKSVPF